MCNAIPSADSPPSLMALDAKVQISSLEGERIIPLENFFVNVRITDLKKEEMVTEIQIPKLLPRTGASFIKLGRAADDIAVVNVAARVTLGQGEKIQDVRLILGAVAPTPLRARKAEAHLMKAGVEGIPEAARIAADEAKPISDVRASLEYRRDMCRVLSQRAFRTAFERAEAR
jgi:carbon-monoxide dehydrogenase medium subunit